jgi:alpha-mannosidase
MATTHLVQHTHWDREWYFTDMDAQILADSLFTEALEELKREPKDNFTLDGQTSIVDEFVASHPDSLQDIQNLVKEGRLFVGPWYSQTDAVNVDPESILRNAIIGQLDAKDKYGDPMHVGYLPDTFGFNANMPALLAHVGLSRFIFWRGMNYDTKVKSPYFKWIAPGGQEATAVNLPPTGYSAAHMTDVVKKDPADYVKNRLDPTTKFVTDIRGDKQALLPVGMDQMNMVQQFPELLVELNKASVNDNIISSYPEFFDALKNVEMPSYQGELRDPVYARVHRSIGSVRSDLKLKNAHTEIKLLRRLEPLMVIAAHNHIHVSTTLLRQVWKILLENQAHDSMGGSVTDNVAVDIEHRFKQANELIDGIENLIKYKLAEALNLSDHQVLMFNTAASKFAGYKTFTVFSSVPNIQLIGAKKQELLQSKLVPERHNIQERTATGVKSITEPAYYELTYRANVTLPALGYKVFEFADGEDTSAVVKEANSIADEQYQVELKSGKVLITTKSGQQYQASLLDSANAGDTYDYSPLDGDSERILPLQTVAVRATKDTQTAGFSGETTLPYDLQDRNNANGKQVAYKYTLELTLGLHDGAVTGKIEVNNSANSHRVRLLIESSAEDTKTIAQIQDAFINTPKTDVPADWEKHYVEKPVGIYTFNKTVSLVGSKVGQVTLITNDMHEYETENGRLYATLFASTGQLGKPNLAWRPGRASGDTTSRGHIMMATPMAQTRGKLDFHFELKVTQSFDYGEIVTAANDYLAADVAYQRQQFNLFANRLDNKIWPEDSEVQLPAQQSVFSLPKAVNVAAIYPAFTDSKSFIVRVVNLNDEAVAIPDELRGAEQVDGLENAVSARTELGRFSITSFKLPL